MSAEVRLLPVVSGSFNETVFCDFAILDVLPLIYMVTGNTGPWVGGMTPQHPGLDAQPYP